MNTELLQHEEFGELRMQYVKGMPWFVAKDICQALGLTNHKQATASLDETEAGVISNDLRSKNGVVQKREMIHVNESGLYQLIFKSRKAKAKKFNCSRQSVIEAMLFHTNSARAKAMRKRGKELIKAELEKVEGYGV